MANSVAELTGQLHAFAKECGIHSLPSRDSLSEAGERQCRIIGSTLLAWLRQHSEHFLGQRIFFEKMKGWDRNPVIVFSSTLPGLLAAREIVGPDHELVVYLPHELVETSSPVKDESEYTYHIHYWSYINEELEPALLKTARKKFPISKKSSYWIHHEGTMWGNLCGSGASHLIEWDGQTPKLLEECFSNWQS